MASKSHDKKSSKKKVQLEDLAESRFAGDPPPVPIQDSDAYRLYLLGRAGLTVTSKTTGQDSELAVACLALGVSECQRAEPLRHRGDAIAAADCLLAGRPVPNSVAELTEVSERLLKKLEEAIVPTPLVDPDPEMRDLAHSEKIVTEQDVADLAETVKSVKEDLNKAFAKYEEKVSQPTDAELLAAGKKAAAKLLDPENILGSEVPEDLPTGDQLEKLAKPERPNGELWGYGFPEPNPVEREFAEKEEPRDDSVPLEHTDDPPGRCPECQRVERNAQRDAGRSPRAG